MRLIDADLVIDTVNDFKGKNRITDLGIKLVKEIVSNAPTVDAEPIRHGHWIPVNPDMYMAEYFECSVCGMYSRDGLFRKELGYEYCPNCGALMDEVENNGEMDKT